MFRRLLCAFLCLSQTLIGSAPVFSEDALRHTQSAEGPVSAGLEERLNRFRPRVERLEARNLRDSSGALPDPETLLQLPLQAEQALTPSVLQPAAPDVWTTRPLAPEPGLDALIARFNAENEAPQPPPAVEPADPADPGRDPDGEPQAASEKKDHKKIAEGERARADQLKEKKSPAGALKGGGGGSGSPRSGRAPSAPKSMEVSRGPKAPKPAVDDLFKGLDNPLADPFGKPFTSKMKKPGAADSSDLPPSSDSSPSDAPEGYPDLDPFSSLQGNSLEEWWAQTFPSMKEPPETVFQTAPSSVPQGLDGALADLWVRWTSENLGLEGPAAGEGIENLLYSRKPSSLLSTQQMGMGPEVLLAMIAAGMLLAEEPAESPPGEKRRIAYLQKEMKNGKERIAKSWSLYKRRSGADADHIYEEREYVYSETDGRLVGRRERVVLGEVSEGTFKPGQVLLDELVYKVERDAQGRVDYYLGKRRAPGADGNPAVRNFAAVYRYPDQKTRRPVSLTINLIGDAAADEEITIFSRGEKKKAGRLLRVVYRPLQLDEERLSAETLIRLESAADLTRGEQAWKRRIEERIGKIQRGSLASSFIRTGFPLGILEVLVMARTKETRHHWPGGKILQKPIRTVEDIIHRFVQLGPDGRPVEIGTFLADDAQIYPEAEEPPDGRRVVDQAFGDDLKWLDEVAAPAPEPVPSLPVLEAAPIAPAAAPPFLYGRAAEKILEERAQKEEEEWRKRVRAERAEANRRDAQITSEYAAEQATVNDREESAWQEWEAATRPRLKQAYPMRAWARAAAVLFLTAAVLVAPHLPLQISRSPAPPPARESVVQLAPVPSEKAPSAPVTPPPVRAPESVPPAAEISPRAVPPEPAREANPPTPSPAKRPAPPALEWRTVSTRPPAAEAAEWALPAGYGMYQVYPSSKSLNEYIEEMVRRGYMPAGAGERLPVFSGKGGIARAGQYLEDRSGITETWMDFFAQQEMTFTLEGAAYWVQAGTDVRIHWSEGQVRVLRWFPEENRWTVNENNSFPGVQRLANHFEDAPGLQAYLQRVSGASEPLKGLPDFQVNGRIAAGGVQNVDGSNARVTVVPVDQPLVVKSGDQRITIEQGRVLILLNPDGAAGTVELAPGQTFDRVERLAPEASLLLPPTGGGLLSAAGGPPPPPTGAEELVTVQWPPLPVFYDLTGRYVQLNGTPVAVADQAETAILDELILQWDAEELFFFSEGDAGSIDDYLAERAAALGQSLHLYVQEDLLREMGMTAEQLAAAVPAYGHLHVVGSETPEIGAVIQDVVVRRAGGQRVFMLVGPEYQEPLLDYFGPQGAFRHLIPTAAVVLSPGALPPLHLLAALMKRLDGISLFSEIEAGLEEGRRLFAIRTAA